MTAAKPKVGDLIDVPEGAVVVRPDGTEYAVTGGAYVLDSVGTFTVGDREVMVG